MNVTPETLAELRRLHAALIAEVAKEGPDDVPFESYAASMARAERDSAAGEHIAPLLDELEAVRAERDRLRAALTELLEFSVAMFRVGASRAEVEVIPAVRASRAALRDQSCQ